MSDIWKSVDNLKGGIKLGELSVIGSGSGRPLIDSAYNVISIEKATETDTSTFKLYKLCSDGVYKLVGEQL